MKVFDNGIVREMTPEEIEQIFGRSENRLTETEQKAAAYDILTGVSE